MNKFSIIVESEYGEVQVNDFTTKKTHEEFMKEVKEEYLSIGDCDFSNAESADEVEDILQECAYDTYPVYVGHATIEYNKVYILDMKNKIFVEPLKEWNKEWKTLAKTIIDRETKRIKIEEAKQAREDALEERKFSAIKKAKEAQREKEQEALDREEYTRLQKKFAKSA